MSKKNKNVLDIEDTIITFSDSTYDSTYDYLTNVKSSDINSTFTYSIDCSVNSTWLTSDSTFTWTDELSDIKKEQAEEEELRKEYQSLQDAWDHYQLIKKLLQEEESDKYLEEKYKGFKE